MLLKELKQKDYDKYLAALLAPKIKQQTLAALFLFHYEISQIPAGISEPMVALIKLQWWHDALNEIIEGKPPRPHPILKVLKEVDYVKLQKIIDQYIALVEGSQPQSLNEIENFMLNTECVILEQAAKLKGEIYNAETALAYALTLTARKLNSNAHGQKFATKPEVLIKVLADKSNKLLPKSNNVFAVIARHYNKNLNNSRWRLLLKLMTISLI